MLKSTQAFLAHILDYAGMFPPARLPLEEALRHFLQYRRTSPDAWMLGRFVCPTASLHDVIRLVQSPDDITSLRITALGQASADSDSILTQFDRDLRLIQDFREEWEEATQATVVEMLEFALPKDVTSQQLSALLPEIRRRLNEANMRGFLEIPRSLYSGRAPGNMTASPGTHAQDVLGLKLRCGGTTADAFPGEEQIASFILHCREHSSPWKATAGLHHPRRFWDPTLKIWHHGFLNVFGAGLLALSNPLTQADLVGILSDRDGQHFHFTDEGFRWKEWTCSLNAIVEIRSRWVLSFGSCSFEEPCVDLRLAGML